MRPLPSCASPARSSAWSADSWARNAASCALISAAETPAASASRAHCSSGVIPVTTGPSARAGSAATARRATLYGSPVSAMRWRAAVFWALSLVMIVSSRRVCPRLPAKAHDLTGLDDTRESQTLVLVATAGRGPADSSEAGRRCAATEIYRNIARSRELYCGCVVSTGQLAAFAVASFILIVIPGPGVLFVIGRALAHGRRTALASVAGHAAGNGVVAVCVALGVGTVV